MNEEIYTPANSDNQESQNLSNTNGRENELMQERSGEAKSGKRTANRGFAAMDPQKQKDIARQGGKAAHLQGVAHRWTSEEAKKAGKKGGQQGGKRTTSEERG
ncbi:MAG: KGG domain-containing protein [Chitinophagaceae bacterium]